MPVLYANNASSTLASAINNSVTSITIGNWANSKFPSIAAGSGDFYFATIEEGATMEIVRVTATNSGTSTLTVTRGQESTTAASFTTAAKIEVRATAGMLDALKTADIWEQTAPGTYTWTKPTGAKLVHVLMYGGGGGGGSGYRRSTSAISAASGGGGGAGGGRMESWIPASALPATVSVTVGAGGGGGAAQTANDTSGVAGSSGTASNFQHPSWPAAGTFRLAAYQGNPGNGGTTTGAVSGPATDQMIASSQDNNLLRNSGGTGHRGTGADPASSFQNGGMSGLGPGGGGGGAGFDASGTAARDGGQGGLGGRNIFWSSSSDTRGGVVNAAGSNSADGRWTGGSGGSGGANSASANPKNGYAGGYPGGGGGGGGAATAANSGAGGAGADGYVRITTFF